jgi:hypothetical protein
MAWISLPFYSARANERTDLFGALLAPNRAGSFARLDAEA